MTARRGLLLAAAATVAVLLLGIGQGTYAYFTDQASVSAGAAGSSSTAFTSGGVATPATPTGSQTGPTAVTISWSATAVGSNGGTAGAYAVVRYTAATGGTGTVVCTTTGALTCVDPNAPAATVWYAVQARIGTNWFKESGRVQHNADTTPPSVVITTPVSGCSTVACGTASDASGVASVTYSLRRTLTGAVTGTQSFDCWNGSAWVGSTSGATCPFLTATGTTSWSVPGARTTAYAATLFYNRSFSLSVRATDALGNQSAAVSATYTA